MGFWGLLNLRHTSMTVYDRVSLRPVTVSITDYRFVFSMAMGFFLGFRRVSSHFLLLWNQMCWAKRCWVEFSVNIIAPWCVYRMVHDLRAYSPENRHSLSKMTVGRPLFVWNGGTSQKPADKGHRTNEWHGNFCWWSTSRNSTRGLDGSIGKIINHTSAI